MADDRPREIELYICNKVPLALEDETVTLCNAPQFCDPETRQRRRCVKLKVTIIGPP